MDRERLRGHNNGCDHSHFRKLSLLGGQILKNSVIEKLFLSWDFKGMQCRALICDDDDADV